MTTLIISKNSNLSNHLKNNLEDSILISSRDILNNVNILDEYKNKRINIIFNNFQPAIQLNNIIYTK